MILEGGKIALWNVALDGYLDTRFKKKKLFLFLFFIYFYFLFFFQYIIKHNTISMIQEYIISKVNL